MAMGFKGRTLEREIIFLVILILRKFLWKLIGNFGSKGRCSVSKYLVGTIIYLDVV